MIKARLAEVHADGDGGRHGVGPGALVRLEIFGAAFLEGYEDLDGERKFGDMEIRAMFLLVGDLDGGVVEEGGHPRLDPC